jgi:ribose-phosphate pyrophosphokinase
MDNVILLADKSTPAWEFAEKIQKHITKHYHSKEFNLCEIDITNFRSGEFLPHVSENIRKADIFYVQSSDKDPNKWWVELLLMKDLCLSASVNSLSYVLPNLLFSRQDRKDKSRVPISARALAKSLFSRKTERIITMDMHSPQIQGFYDESVPIDNLYSFPTVVDYIRKNHSADLENMVIVSPDAGGVGRGMSFLKRMIDANKSDHIKHDYSFAFTHKLRSKPGEIGDMWFVGDVKGKNTLIVDDIYDSCGTLIKCAGKLIENGAKKVLTYGTHGLYTEGTDCIIKNVNSVMTSNTHYVKKDGDGQIEVIDMAPSFAEAIYRAQKGISISEMFD